MNKDIIKITSKLSKGLSTKITLSGEIYLVDTEDLGIKAPCIVTRVYRKGEIISSHKVDYNHILGTPDFNERFSELIQRQHKKAIEALKREVVVQTITCGEYIVKVENLLKKNSQEDALKLLTEAMKHYTNNPFIFSYQGYLEAFVNKNYSKGVTTCRQAFKILKEQVPFGEEFYYPILYLNLGRTYLLANKKRLAQASFKKGLEIDTENRDLLFELKKLGIRKKPPLTFLKRSNPLNKYIGKLLYTLKKQTSLTFT
ncbi:MAG: hypothetical protein OEZ31_08325 [Nitrospirota bacterium]|nr:hypothetical protein [Nitrospirota bacterium]MDH5768946.1 hypothetical protein [Nitrospirota bacterium]